MIRTNVCLRHRRDGDTLHEDDYDGSTIEIEDAMFVGMVADFEKDTTITDDVAASAVGVILDVARLPEGNIGERENFAQSIACAVLRQNFINNFGADAVGHGIITVMDETAVDGEIVISVNDDGEPAKFFVTLGS